MGLHFIELDRAPKDELFTIIVENFPYLEAWPCKTAARFPTHHISSLQRGGYHSTPYEKLWVYIKKSMLASRLQFIFMFVYSKISTDYTSDSQTNLQ